MYKFNGIDIKSLGATPGKIAGEHLSIGGLFDMPKRIGETEYNWGTSVEPLVDKEDIKLDGRMLTLTAIVSSNRLDDFKREAVACKVLSTNFGNFNVIQKDAISIERHADINVVTTKFWQAEYEIPELSIVPSGGAYFLIGLYNLAFDFGIYMKSRSSLDDVSKRIETQTTGDYAHTSYREPIDLTFQCYMRANTSMDAYNKMMQFHSLLASPGVKDFTDSRNKQHKVYFKNGITCKLLMDGLLSFDLKMRRLND